MSTETGEFDTATKVETPFVVTEFVGKLDHLLVEKAPSYEHGYKPNRDNQKPILESFTKTKHLDDAVISTECESDAEYIQQFVKTYTGFDLEPRVRGLVAEALARAQFASEETPESRVIRHALAGSFLKNTDVLQVQTVELNGKRRLEITGLEEVKNHYPPNEHDIAQLSHAVEHLKMLSEASQGRGQHDDLAAALREAFVTENLEFPEGGIAVAEKVALKIVLPGELKQGIDIYGRNEWRRELLAFSTRELDAVAGAFLSSADRHGKIF